MKCAIYGAGSLGTILGAYLTKNGFPIELVNRNVKHVEALQKNGGESPTYEITGQSGPPHNPVFEAAVYWNGKLLAQGEGKTKKQAEQAAALEALRAINP